MRSKLAHTTIYHTNRCYTTTSMFLSLKLVGICDSILNNTWVIFHAVTLKKSGDIVLQWFWGSKLAHTTIYHTNGRYADLFMFRSMKLGWLNDSVSKNMRVNFHAAKLQRSWDIVLQWFWGVEICTHNNLPANGRYTNLFYDFKHETWTARW